MLGRQTSRLARCTSQQNLLVASRCQFSYNGRVSVASQAADGRDIFFASRGWFSVVTVVYQLRPTLLEPVKVDKK